MTLSEKCSADYTWFCPDCGNSVSPLSYASPTGEMFYKRRSFCKCPGGQRKSEQERDRTASDEWASEYHRLMSAAGLDKGIYGGYRFDRWSVDRNAPHSKVAWEKVDQFVQGLNDLEGRNWLYLYGPNGLGKTHLAIAAVRKLIQLRLWSAHVVIWPELCQATKESWKASGGPTEAQLWGRARGARVLLIDDLDKAATTEWAMGKLFGLINNRSVQARPTIITANRSLKQLQTDWSLSPDPQVRDIGLAVLSRIAGSLWGGVEFKGQDQRWVR